MAAGVQLAPQQQQQQQATGAGSSQAGGLTLGAVLAAYRSLDRRLADTCHAELRTSATTQAEVLAQLQSCGQLQGRDWVLVVPTGGSPAGIAVRAVSSGMRLEDGWCMASGNDGQQVGGFSNHFVSMCLRALRLAELNLPPSMVDDESCSLSLTALNAAAACCCCSRLL